MALAAPRQPAPSFSTTTLGWHAIPHQTLLVYAEQGLGDTLQFVRYLPRVAARGKHVVLACNPRWRVSCVPALGCRHSW